MAVEEPLVKGVHGGFPRVNHIQMGQCMATFVRTMQDMGIPIRSIMLDSELNLTIQVYKYVLQEKIQSDPFTREQGKRNRLRMWLQHYMGQVIPRLWELNPYSIGVGTDMCYEFLIMQTSIPDRLAAPVDLEHCPNVQEVNSDDM